MSSSLISLPFLFATLVELGLVFAWARRPRTRLARKAIYLAALTAIWCGLWFMSALVPDTATKFYLTNLRVAASGTLAPAMFLLERAMVGRRRLSPRWFPLLVAVPVITIALALTSPYHDWFLRGLTVVPSTGMVVLGFGPWFRVHGFIGYVLMIYVLFDLAVAATRATPPHRQRLWWGFASLIPSSLAEIAFISGLWKVPGYSLSPAFAGLSGVFTFIILTRFPFLEIVPVARHKVVDMIDQAMFVVDAEGRLADINREGLRLLGPVPRERLGLPALECFPRLSSVLAAGAEGKHIVPDVQLDVEGRARHYDVHISPLQTDQVRQGHVFVFQDVTDLRRREQEAREHATRLEELDRLKDGFVSTVSHELRTPLGSILGLTDVLLDERLPSDARRHVEAVRRSGEALLSLVNDILDLSKVKAGKVEVDSVPFVPGALLEEALEAMAPLAQSKGLTLEWYCPVTGPVTGDPHRLRQILVNLVSNALKFTTTGGVQVIAGFPPGQLTISVIDTGPGIPADKREAIFDEFTQLDLHGRGHSGGTGLGLPISRRLARLMGGDVTVDASPQGGSSFTVTVRLAAGDIVSRPPPPASRSLIVLYCDAPLRRSTLEEAFVGLGFEVQSVQEWSALAELARAEPPAQAIWICANRVTAEQCAQLPVKPGQTLFLELGPAAHSDWSSTIDLPNVRALRGPVWTRELPELLSRREPPPDVAPAPVIESSGRIRMLVADDVPENIRLVAAYISGQPIEMVAVVNGQEAVERFRSERYDVVVLDIDMPVMDGLTAVREMRAWEKQQGRRPQPILAMTAHGQPEHVSASLAAGFNRHLTRPIGKKAFLEAITAAAGAPVPSPAPAPVSIDTTLQALRDNYVSDLSERVSWLRDRVGAADYLALKRFGHQLSGTGSSYGLAELGAIGRGIETAAEESPDRLIGLVDAFAQAVDTARREQRR